jgi:hypothetical protein
MFEDKRRFKLVGIKLVVAYFIFLLIYFLFFGVDALVITHEDNGIEGVPKLLGSKLISRLVLTVRSASNHQSQ